MHGLILISIAATVALGQDVCKRIHEPSTSLSDPDGHGHFIVWDGPICTAGSMVRDSGGDFERKNLFYRDFSNCSEANKLMPTQMQNAMHFSGKCEDYIETHYRLPMFIPNRCVVDGAICAGIKSIAGDETFVNMFGNSDVSISSPGLRCCLPKMKCQNFECPDGWESNANQDGNASETQCCYDNNNALFSLANYLGRLDQTKDCAQFLNSNTQYTCETPLSEFKKYSTSGNLTYYFNSEPLPFQNGKIKDICQCHCNGIKESSVCYTERCCYNTEEEEIAQIIETWIIVTIVLSSLAAIAGSITAIVLCRRPGGCQCRVRTGPSVKATTIVYTKVNLEDTLKF